MSSPIIRSALPVFEALRLVANSTTPMSTADLSRIVKLPTSTVHRFLGTLEEAGYITRYAGSPKYIPGNIPQHLCRALFNRLPLSRIGEPFMRKIAVLTHETVTMTVRIGWFGLRVEVIGDAAQVMDASGPDILSPLHMGIEGQAILAFLSSAEQRNYQQFLSSQDSDQANPESSLWKDLQRFRDLGFAIAPLGADGQVALVLPVRDDTNEAVGSIGIIGSVIDAGATRPTSEMRAWIRIRDELEAALQRDPANMVNPFAHLAPGAIMRMSKRTRRTLAKRPRKPRAGE